MPVRALLIFSIIICLATASCKNEPYEPSPLGVLTIANHVTSATLNYQYHNKRLYTFLSRKAADTLANMKFYFQHDELDSIISDSTKSAHKVTKFYNAGGPSVTDSTFIYAAGTIDKVSARVISYDGDNHPTSVAIRTFKNNEVTEQRADLTWQDGNVIRLVTTDVTAAKVLSDVSIAYDDQTGVYLPNPEYIFTFSLQELYWLSKNNPISFNDGTRQNEYVYSYNKLGYPASYQTHDGITYGITYREIR